jgi:hypothetical protein
LTLRSAVAGPSGCSFTPAVGGAIDLLRCMMKKAAFAEELFLVADAFSFAAACQGTRAHVTSDQI